jgi:hypothetical protein
MTTTSKRDAIAISRQIQVHKGAVIVAQSVRIDPHLDLGGWDTTTGVVQAQDDGFFPIKGQ